MTNFTKWPSIENSYQAKNINFWLERYPELNHVTYVITEKIHGSNFQWYFQSDQPIMAGSRNGWINLDGSFQGVTIAELMATEAPILTSFQNLANSTGNTYRLFGELFGGNIQKGVDYGNDKRLLYFGLMVNDVLQPFRTLITEYVNIMEKLVPVVDFVEGLAAALAFSPYFDSKILNVPGNIVEGVVIMPYAKVYHIEGGSTFGLKHKNKEFAEIAHAPKPTITNDKVTQLNLEFRAYITENRLQSVFSQNGMIEKPAQIGQYIQLLIEDARVDFLKAFDVSDLDKHETRQVFNVGSMAVELIKAHL